MNQNSVFCIAFSRIQADQMVQRLKSAAFSAGDISVLFAVGPQAAVLGEVARVLFNQGVPLLKARLYESKIKSGGTLVSVQTASADEMKLAKEILSKAGGNDLCATNEPLQQYRQPVTPHATQNFESRLSMA